THHKHHLVLGRVADCDAHLFVEDPAGGHRFSHQDAVALGVALRPEGKVHRVPVVDLIERVGAAIDGIAANDKVRGVAGQRLIGDHRRARVRGRLVGAVQHWPKPGAGAQHSRQKQSKRGRASALVSRIAVHFLLLHMLLFCDSRPTGENRRTKRRKVPLRITRVLTISVPIVALLYTIGIDTVITTSYYIWPGQVHFGFGGARRVGEEAKTEGARNVFVIGDPGVAAAGLLDPIVESLAAAGLAHVTYTDVVPNPDTGSVDTAVAAFRESQAD